MVLFKSMSFTPYWRGYNFEINTQNIYIIVNIKFFVIKLRIKSSLYLPYYNFYYIMHYIECSLPTIIAQLSCFYFSSFQVFQGNSEDPPKHQAILPPNLAVQDLFIFILGEQLLHRLWESKRRMF